MVIIIIRVDYKIGPILKFIYETHKLKFIDIIMWYSIALCLRGKLKNPSKKSIEKENKIAFNYKIIYKYIIISVRPCLFLRAYSRS